MIFTEDMDISESEHSDIDALDDDDDDDWVQSDKKQIRRRASKSRTSSLGVHQPDTNGSENKKGCTDEVTGKNDVICCTCSQKSLCKTSKCQCRANGSSCGQSCGCTSIKCSNREAEADSANDAGISETNNLVAQGAMLLQNAFGSEKPAETNDDFTTKRKALSDIGNTMVSFLVFYDKNIFSYVTSFFHFLKVFRSNTLEHTYQCPNTPES